MKKALLAVAIVISALVLIAAYVFQFNPFNRPQHVELFVGNLQREFYYHAPKGVSEKPQLIFVLHGSTGTPEVAQLSTGHQFDKLADESKDAIIVYPAGYHKYWNDCRKVATYDAKKQNIDDVAFFGKMIAYFKERYHIDTARVFAVGHSNGGHMCYKLAKEKPEWFKGVAAISASLPVDENNDCYDAHQPVSVLVMNGTSDPINPFNGGEVVAGDGQKRGAVRSTDQTIQYWIENDSCNAAPTITNFPDLDASDNSTAAAYLYQNAMTGKQVELVKITNGGHVIPNPTFSLWPKSLGNVNKDINAPKIIWDFFKGL